ncbi:MAG: alpha/beta hydrolase-fold protein, partial [Bacteroidota bacterium]|nr:alpha/beta hydrolase-fold protein [Bacteroidota bacterium]
MRTKFSLTVLFTWTALALFGQLTINVTSIPVTTPPGAQIYFAGNANNWNPGQQAYQLTDNGNGSYTFTFSPAAGTVEYKFTRGSWETVEGNANGGFIPNRTISYNGSAQNVNVTIAGWEGEGTHSASDNVSILDEDFFIPQLNRNRRIWIYLPPDYNSTSKRYPVLYMHDGQNLFDTYYSFAGEWKVDESLNALFNQGDYGAIVVGIDNGGGQRINEYSNWNNPNYGGGQGELYSAFLAETLKPHIDANYRTLSAKAYTGIVGSSMGGLISLSTAIEYPDVFGKVGIFSPALWFSDSCYTQVATEGVDPDLKIYFIGGDTESQSMVPDMVAMRDTLISAGLESTQVGLEHDADGAHMEWYWAREFPHVYQWLFDDLILDTKDPKITDCFTYPNPADQYLKIQGGLRDF